jgi:hypothetical protein
MCREEGIPWDSSAAPRFLAKPSTESCVAPFARVDRAIMDSSCSANDEMQSRRSSAHTAGKQMQLTGGGRLGADGLLPQLRDPPFNVIVAAPLKLVMCWLHYRP